MWSHPSWRETELEGAPQRHRVERNRTRPGGAVTLDWPFVVGGIGVSLVLVPLFVYLRLVARPTVLAGIPYVHLGLLATLPGVLMGGVGLWVAARG